jgi:hypothetical protein
VSFDLRGHGASEAPDGEYTLAMLAQDALALPMRRACGVSAMRGSRSEE